MQNKTEEVDLSACDICRKEIDDPVEFGAIMKKGSVKAHYYCLLLSTNLVQRGQDASGILGFLLHDIKTEIAAASKRTCIYCKGLYASVACQECKKYFHIVCGNKNDCVFEFIGNFYSFCHEHHKITHSVKHKSNEGCYICREVMANYNPTTSITSKCCKINCWVHRKCLRRYALSAGYYLRCIWCESISFREDMRYLGIFVPDRDATWERKNAYADFYKSNQFCSAKECKCTKGRYYMNKLNWQIIPCKACGTFGIHSKCSSEKLFNSEFICNTCKKVFDSVKSQSRCSELDLSVYMSKSPYLSIDNFIENTSFDENNKSIKSNLSEDQISEQEIPETQKEKFAVLDSEKHFYGLVEGCQKDPSIMSIYLRPDEVNFSSEDIYEVNAELRKKSQQVFNKLLNGIIKAKRAKIKTNQNEVLCVSDSDSELSVSGLLDKMAKVEKKKTRKSIVNKEKKNYPSTSRDDKTTDLDSFEDILRTDNENNSESDKEENWNITSTNNSKKSPEKMQSGLINELETAEKIKEPDNKKIRIEKVNTKVNNSGTSKNISKNGPYATFTASESTKSEDIFLTQDNELDFTSRLQLSRLSTGERTSQSQTCQNYMINLFLERMEEET